MKPNREALINEMISDIDFGMDRGDVMEGFVEKWQLSTRTFDRYWQVAKKQYDDEQKAVRLERQEIKIDAEVSKVQGRIMDKIERLAVLTSIADGTLSIQKTAVTKMGVLTYIAVPDFNDRKTAIAELNKMDGEYAPIRKETKHSGDVTVKQDLSQLSTEDLLKRAQATKAIDEQART